MNGLNQANQAKQAKQVSHIGVKGQYALITGATSGIGLAAAHALTARGMNIGIVARNESKANETAAQLRAACSEPIHVDVYIADLSSQQSIRSVADQIAAKCPKIDRLINNAGAMFVERKVTADGLEMTWAVNHMAPFLLTTLLLERGMLAEHARIITTSSHGHKMARKGISFDDLSGKRQFGLLGKMTGGPNFRYAETKLANILFSSQLAEHLKGTGITAYSFDPGLVSTNFNQDNGLLARMTMAVMKRFSSTAEHGAETLVWLAETDAANLANGGYYADKQAKTPSAAARDMKAAKRLWEVSVEQTYVSQP
ncbi:short-chain dehydrogenase [Paenibacillus sp. CCS19]|uniref:SDR family oxidoreductase n=1 Tax=Paenibacillus sp. CCS19 TaxID=3158387 RepID=UPI00256AFED7|nr:SDR family oxidoreductase [Paenibacillus cellulosilyticus]GMK41209.1 short-chain dehydrogenase [Paenibacillus cellulosilyticus]